MATELNRPVARSTAASAVVPVLILLAFLVSVILMFMSTPERTPIQVIRTTPVPTVPSTIPAIPAAPKQP